MNRKISIAVGTAAAVAFSGAAMASDLVTINNTEGYITNTNAIGKFVPAFITNDCGGFLNTTGSCPDHGLHLVMQAAGMMGNIYWSGGDAVPALDTTENSGYAMLYGHGDAFDNGLFRTNGSSYFTGLSLGWDTLGDANADVGGAPDVPIGAPTGIGAEQTVVGYVESLNLADSSVALAQNFRSQLSWTNATVNLATAKIDQRLEQMVELTNGSNYPFATTGAPGNANQFEASRQTIQMAFATTTGLDNTLPGGAGFQGNATTQPDFNNATNLPGNAGGVGQLVAQDIEGFFFSCLNCDNANNNAYTHVFTPEDLDISYQPYHSGWNVVPTIVHANP